MSKTLPVSAGNELSNGALEFLKGPSFQLPAAYYTFFFYRYHLDGRTTTELATESSVRRWPCLISNHTNLRIFQHCIPDKSCFLQTFTYFIHPYSFFTGIRLRTTTCTLQIIPSHTRNTSLHGLN